MKTKVFLSLISIPFLLFSCNHKHEAEVNNSEPDDFYEKCRQLVLTENKIAKTYNFKIESTAIDELKHPIFR